MTDKTATQTIDTLLRSFEKGDVQTLLAHMADDIDFRIDHYRDYTDVAWQQARGKQELLNVLQRLGQEIFPKGTRMLEVASSELGDGWALTRLRQEFYYGLAQQTVSSATWIVSHSTGGRCDYFRETVTDIVPMAASA